MNPFEGHSLPKGYQLVDLLYRNERHEVFTARNEEGTVHVLKRARTKDASIQEVSKIAHEYDILKEVQHPGIPAVYDLMHQQDALILVQEYIPGLTLNEMLFKGPVDPERFFGIAIQLAGILSVLHEKGIIHKDLNASNVIVGEQDKVSLVDFGISSNLHYENAEASLVDHIEGTLTHIAPEQTGRTAYTLTHSCDIYSFGILLYELLTGKPPFDSSDPLEIVHFHLSRKPLPVSKVRKSVPFGMDELIARCLEKNPDDRYQSARGLKVDLELLQQYYLKGSNPGTFTPGLHDRIDHYRHTQRLYGREKEIHMLLSDFEQLSKLRSMLVLVSGYSGVGKSALIESVKHPIVQKNGIFISGKFDQFKKNIPYFALISAFEEFTRKLLTESDEVIANWRRRIQAALGGNGALITEVIPILTKIIGKQEEVAKMQPAEQETRFKKVLLDFVFSFSAPQHPLVIFMDDLQWADYPTLHLLQMILNNPRKDGVMLLGAYRSNEVGEEHPLHLMFKELNRTGANLHQIDLHPLDEPTTCLITRDSFGMNDTESEALGRLVFEKTNGNPFFINRFLKSLYDTDQLSKDELGDWKWDAEQIQEMAYTDNVVDLMIGEMMQLPTNTQQVLKFAAVLGNTFSLTDVVTISGFPPDTVFQDLKPALHTGMVAPMDKKYRAYALTHADTRVLTDYLSDLKASFRFTHDKVQQAAYDLVSEAEKEQFHLDTVRVLMSNLDLDEQHEHVFVLLNHFLQCYRLLEEEPERIHVAELCLVAGTKAKDSTSYDLAVKFLELGKRMLDGGQWNKHYKLTFDTLFLLGECQYLNDEFDRAEQHFKEVLQQAHSNYEKLQVYYVHSSLYLKQGNTAESLRIGLEAVRLYNVRFPKNKLMIKLLATAQLFGYLILFSTKYRNPEKLFNLPDCEDQEIVDLNKFFIDLATSAYQQSQFLMMLVIFKIIGSYLKSGFTDASGWGFSGLSVVTLSGIRLQGRGLKLWKLTRNLHQRTHSPLIKWRLGYTVNNFYNPWVRPIREAFEENLEILQACLHNGDQIFTAYSVAMQQRHAWYAGVELGQLIKESQGLIKYIQSEGGRDFFIAKYQLIKALAGQTQLGVWDDEQFSEAETTERLLRDGNMTTLAFFFYSKLPLLFFYGHYREGVDLAKETEKYFENIIGDIEEMEYTFYYAMCIAGAYSGFNAHERRKYRKVFKKQLKLVQLWAKACAFNFEQHAHLLQAEWHSMHGQTEQAIVCYERSISKATQNGFRQVEAIANERAAFLSQQHGLKKQGQLYLKDAWDAYNRWGATGKCRQLEISFPSMLKEMSLAVMEGHSAQRTRTSFSSKVALDLSSILKASQTIAGEVKYDELVKKLMNVVIENAGAQRGCFLIKQQDELVVEIEVAADDLSDVHWHSKKLQESDVLPHSPVLYVWRTGEPLVVENMQTDERFHGDPFVTEFGTQSVMCVPILEKGVVQAIIYLENSLLKGAFTEDRLELVSMLTGQIGISIENASLYENLEEKVRTRTKELEEQKRELELEKDKSDRLLLNILPRHTAQELKSTGEFKARSYPMASVMFCDIVGFTQLGERLDAPKLVSDLHELFSGIDDIVGRYSIEKIKTIGDAYLCACGLTEEGDGASANDMVAAAKEIVVLLEGMNKRKKKSGEPEVELRVGIHTGPVVAGVVGKTKFAYDIWGDTVNLAARMESHSDPMRINISEETYQLVKAQHPCTHRGKVEAKNKGAVDMYFVEMSA